MLNRFYLRRVLTLAAITLAALVLAACGGSSSTPGMNHGTTTATTSTAASTAASFSAADVEFAQTMIVHHQQAVQMSTLAETRAADPEVKTLAAAIKAAQQPEITTMTGWLTSWGQPTAQPGGHNMGTMPSMGTMPGMASGAEMTHLGTATGTDFDRMFARLMIAHHNGAIRMADDVLAKGTSPQAKTLAASIKQSQAAEVNQLQKIVDRL